MRAILALLFVLQLFFNGLRASAPAAGDSSKSQFGKIQSSIAAWWSAPTG